MDIYIYKNTKDRSMVKMEYKTKAGSVGGSTITVIPLALSRLLNIKKGSEIIWLADVSSEGIKVTITSGDEDKSSG